MGNLLLFRYHISPFKNPFNRYQADEKPPAKTSIEMSRNRSADIGKLLISQPDQHVTLQQVIGRYKVEKRML